MPSIYDVVRSAALSHDLLNKLVSQSASLGAGLARITEASALLNAADYGPHLRIPDFHSHLGTLVSDSHSPFAKLASQTEVLSPSMRALIDVAAEASKFWGKDFESLGVGFTAAQLDRLIADPYFDSLGQLAKGLNPSWLGRFAQSDLFATTFDNLRQFDLPSPMLADLLARFPADGADSISDGRELSAWLEQVRDWFRAALTVLPSTRRSQAVLRRLLRDLLLAIVGSLAVAEIQEYRDRDENRRLREEDRAMSEQISRAFQDIHQELQKFQPDDPFDAVARRRAKVYASPSSQAPLLGRLKVGQKVTVVSVERRWWRIEYPANGTPDLGWVFSGNLARQP